MAIEWDKSSLADEKRSQEAKLISLRFNAFLPKTREILKGTALIDETREPKESDVSSFKKLLLTLAPYSSNNLYPNYWSHVVGVAIAMKILTEETRSGNPRVAEVKGYSHDLEVPFDVHYARRNALGAFFGRKLGLRPELYEKDDALRILGKPPEIRSIGDMSLENVIEDFSDNLIKTTALGRLKYKWSIFKGSLEESIQYLKVV